MTYLLGIIIPPFFLTASIALCCEPYGDVPTSEFSLSRASSTLEVLQQRADPPDWTFVAEIRDRPELQYDSVYLIADAYLHYASKRPVFAISQAERALFAIASSELCGKNVLAGLASAAKYQSSQDLFGENEAWGVYELTANTISQQYDLPFLISEFDLAACWLSLMDEDFNVATDGQLARCRSDLMLQP